MVLPLLFYQVREKKFIKFTQQTMFASLFPKVTVSLSQSNSDLGVVCGQGVSKAVSGLFILFLHFLLLIHHLSIYRASGYMRSSRKYFGCFVERTDKVGGRRRNLEARCWPLVLSCCY